MTGREQVAFWIYAILNLSAVLFWLSARVGRAPSLLSAVMMCLLLGMPLGGVAAWWLRRGRRAALARPARLYFTLSPIFLTLAWLPLAVLAAAWVALAEPWPLSQRHGPDTAYAREVFAAHCGFPPPASVTQLYGRREWAGFGEHIASITFQFTDDQVIRDIVDHLSLEPVPREDVPVLGAMPGPRWWPSREELAEVAAAYRSRWGANPQVFRHLWIDGGNGRAYFQDVDVG